MYVSRKELADHNRSRVFNVIHRKGPINRSEIAKRLGLSIPTIMKIVADFMDEGVVHEEGKGGSTGGTRPVLYNITKDAYYCIGLDIGRSNMNTVITNLKGEIVSNRLISVRDIKEPEDFVNSMIEEIEVIIKNSNIPSDKILGIGIGVPGIIDIEEGIIIYSPNFNWKNVDIITPIGERFDCQIIIENSNRTMALGEQWFGIGKNAEIILCVNIGQGIGGAILTGDEIYYGDRGASGEIGHMVLEKNGPICECGNYGCLQALSSGDAIAKKMNKKEAKEVFELAKEGDPQANKTIDDAIEYLGIGIASSINILDPELVILSGGIMRSSEFFKNKLLKSIDRHRMKYSGRNVKITKSSLEDNASALGAVVLLLKQFRTNGIRTNN